MKPDFALTLSFEGISLLRRTMNGWYSVGDVSLDDADLAGTLTNLRAKAEDLSPNGSQVKLVIPNEQIKYLSIPETGSSGDALASDIKQALDGATPYSVDDLKFDWCSADGRVQVAAVANETLQEALGFAQAYGFEPVCFVARPPEDAFSGEVFFGAAESWSGSPAERDLASIEIVAPPPVLPTVPPAPEPVEEQEIAEDNTLFLSSKAREQDAHEAPPPTLNPPAEPTPQDAGDAAPAFASIRASRDVPPRSQAAPASPVTEPAAPAKRRLSLGGARKSAKTADITAPALQVEAESSNAPAERSVFGFFSRRKPATAPAAPPAQAAAPIEAAAARIPETAPSMPRHDPTPARDAVARIAAMRTGRSNADATAVPAGGGAAVVDDERQRMTIFGARSGQQIGGKPRFLGLMLTAALLLFLLAVAAWATVFLDEGLARFFRPDNGAPDLVEAPLPETLLPESGVESEADANVQLAALETELDPEALSDAPQPLSVIPPADVLTPEEAAARYASTGIWQRAPSAPLEPSVTSIDDIYVASIDRSVPQLDAVALPDAGSLRLDQPYLTPANPALPGTRFTLDERGLVIATPEGSVNPEGVRVFAGLPPVVPPLRPDAPETALPEPADQAITNRLQAFRPNARPTGLIESRERAQLAGRTLAELAVIRPAARPAIAKQQKEDAQPEATKLAVAASSKPLTRPRNFASIVENAKQNEAAQVTQVAAIAPRTVQPSIPSSASVARQATVSNAINLKRINLIGVYGKPSSRRALVRLSNGRYQKVKVGDRLDGGRVAAIGNSELRYTKGGRNITLDMPN